MTIEEIINQGHLATGVMIIAAVLVYLAFAETSPLRKKK